jgi:hypothetical protein
MLLGTGRDVGPTGTRAIKNEAPAWDRGPRRVRFVVSVVFTPTRGVIHPSRPARTINNLREFQWTSTKLDKLRAAKAFPASASLSIKHRRVWWWAQNWAQSLRRNRASFPPLELDRSWTETSAPLILAGGTFWAALTQLILSYFQKWTRNLMA